MTPFVIEGRQASVGLHGVMEHSVKVFGGDTNEGGVASGTTYDRAKGNGDEGGVGSGVVTMHPRPVTSRGDIVGESVVYLRVNVKEGGGVAGGSSNVTSTGRVDGNGACDFTLESVGE